MPSVNSVLDQRYRLLGLIGSGATGEVWRARDERLQRIVAVKTVDLSVRHRDPGVVARFHREAQTSAGMASPYIAAVYDSGQDGQLLYLVMELLSGPSLAALVDADGPLDLDRGLTIAAEVASGLADAHAAGVVHRDLKPANVVLSDGVAKLVDFGIARFTAEDDQTLTAASTVAGTAAYMSPEQASGREVTAASDVYSLGCLLFTIFTGRPPLGGTTAVQQAVAHVHQAPPDFASVRPDAPAGLAALVDRLLAQDPGRRPDARAAARTLAALREDSSIDVLPDTAPLAAVDVPAPPSPSPTRLLDPAPAAPTQPAPAATPRRRGALLPWLVTLVLAAAAAVVSWTVYQQSLTPSPIVPTASASVMAPTTSAPTVVITPTMTTPTRSTAPRTTATATTTSSAPAPASTGSATSTTTTTTPKPTASTQPSETPTP